MTKVTSPNDRSECGYVVGPGFDSTSPAFVSRASQAAEIDGRIVKKRNRVPLFGGTDFVHNLCRCRQHFKLVQTVPFWNNTL